MWNLAERADRAMLGIRLFHAVIFRSELGKSNPVERAELALVTNLQKSCGA